MAKQPNESVIGLIIAIKVEDYSEITKFKFLFDLVLGFG